MLRYRSDLQRNLTALEADGNIRHLAEQAQTVAAKLLQGVEVEGATLVLTLADGSTMSVVLPASGGGGGGVEEAPEDNIARARRNADWVPIDVLEAPNDGRAYNRKSKQWVVAESGGAGGTPSTDYPRVRGAWSETLNVKINDLVEHKGMLWRARGDYGTGTSEPSFGDAGTWMPVSFLPGGVVNDPLTQRLYHRFFVAPSDADPDGRYDTVDIATILNEFEKRIRALE